MARISRLQTQLADARSQKVAFVSHCLLNQNVRYLGGAVTEAAVDEIVDQMRASAIGVVQMPCPEQLVWGGVLKRRMLSLYGSPLARSPAGRRLLARVVRLWTVSRYRGLARQVAAQIRDYLDSGCDVIEIVGVGPSPSCGVMTTVALGGALQTMARCDPRTLTPAIVNRDVVAANVIAGRGIFIDQLDRQLARRRINVPLRQHTLGPEAGSPA